MFYLFIVNPVSGNGKSLKVAKAIEEYCKFRRLKFKIVYTNKKNDAIDIANFYKNRSNIMIYSVGGDGTLNEIVNGIANSKACLGLIPSGTGNDFYRSLKDFDGSKIDLGKVNDKYFINVASLGFDAEIANYANDLKKHNIPNNLVYGLSIANKLFTYKPVNLNIDKNNKDTTILTVCNGKYYGGGFKIAPNAKLNNGLFDVIDVNSLNRLEIINLIFKLIKVKHIGSNAVNFYTTNNINVYSDIPINCNIDGEIIKSNQFNFSIEKETINVNLENNIKIINFLKAKKLIK